MNDFIRANGGMLAVMAVIVAIGAAYLEWRIGEHVTEQFEAAGLISPDRMSAAEQDIQEEECTHGHSTLFGSLADKAIRDYFSTIIESDKMWRIEE